VKEDSERFLFLWVLYKRCSEEPLTATSPLAQEEPITFDPIEEYSEGPSVHNSAPPETNVDLFHLEAALFPRGGLGPLWCFL